MMLIQNIRATSEAIMRKEKMRKIVDVKADSLQHISKYK